MTDEDSFMGSFLILLEDYMGINIQKSFVFSFFMGNEKMKS